MDLYLSAGPYEFQFVVCNSHFSGEKHPLSIFLLSDPNKSTDLTIITQITLPSTKIARTIHTDFSNLLVDQLSHSFEFLYQQFTSKTEATLIRQDLLHRIRDGMHEMV